MVVYRDYMFPSENHLYILSNHLNDLKYKKRNFEKLTNVEYSRDKNKFPELLFSILGVVVLVVVVVVMVVVGGTFGSTQ